MIQKMLDAQKGLLKALDKGKDIRRWGELDVINYFLTCISSEVEEARKQLPWEEHENYSNFSFDRRGMGEETIDILHYLLEIWILLGMSGQDVYKSYMKKREKNLRKWLNSGRITKEMYDAVS